MSLFDVIAVLITLAAALGYLNHRWLRLPPTIGILTMALAGSLIVILADRLEPTWRIEAAVNAFLGQIDFTNAVMRGMLCFLLFAGALNVNWEHLRLNGWTVGSLATLGVVISTAIVGLLTHLLFSAIGYAVPLPVCFVFGALISPTDPIAVLGLLRELRAPRDLEAKIAGESLFNDGVGVVVFFAFVSMAGLAHGSQGSHLIVGASDLAMFFVRQVGGGLLLGLGLGYTAYRAVKSIDYGPLELLITVALVMLTYSVSFWLQISGPIAVVAAGLLIGTHGRRYAMSEATVRHIDAFWGMVDEILNSVLFLLLGLEIYTIHWRAAIAVASVLVVPIVLLARLISVGIPIGALRPCDKSQRGLVPILTWGGLRGGLSVAMVLSLPQFDAKNLLLGSTYAAVVFSILVQGLTMRRLCNHYGLCRSEG